METAKQRLSPENACATRWGMAPLHAADPLRQQGAELPDNLVAARDTTARNGNAGSDGKDGQGTTSHPHKPRRLDSHRPCGSGTSPFVFMIENTKQICPQEMGKRTVGKKLLRESTLQSLFLFRIFLVYICLHNIMNRVGTTKRIDAFTDC